MERLSGGAVSTMFTSDVDARSDNEESIHDATLEFSFDLSGDLDLTSTPAKSTSIEDDLRSASEASSPVSFTAPPFSPLPTLGSPLSELQTNDQSSTVASDGDSNLQVATAPEENNIQFSEKERGMKIVGDNIDKNVHTRFMRVDKQGSSLHYFNAYAAQDRFDLTMPEDVPAIPDDPKLFEDLLPSNSDKITLKEYFAIHIARILCKYMPFFAEDFGDVIPEHLDHPMSSEMRQKSQVVSITLCMCISSNLLHVCYSKYNIISVTSDREGKYQRKRERER